MRSVVDLEILLCVDEISVLTLFQTWTRSEETARFRSPSRVSEVSETAKFTSAAGASEVP